MVKLCKVRLFVVFLAFHFGVSPGLDSEAMDGAFAALSWDDSTVKASSLARAGSADLAIAAALREFF